VLRKESPKTRIVVCEPEEAPLLGSKIEQKRKADGTPAAPHPSFKPHPMQGWTPDFIPKLTSDAVDMKVIDRLLQIPGPEAIRCSKELATKEGIFVGITSNLRRGAAGRQGGGEGRQHPVHAAGHGRALPQHAAVRRRPRGHDRGGAGDLTLDAKRPAEDLRPGNGP
jgi:hypothetical protein